MLALSAPTQQYGLFTRPTDGAFSQSQPGLRVLRHPRRALGMSNFRLKFRAILPAPAPTPSAPSYSQRTPIHRRLIPPTDLYYDARWAAQRAMDAPRAKRTRASVNYAEPTELDDDIDEPTVPASDDYSSDAEIVASDTESDSGSDEEFTTDKVSNLIAE
jgi:hypothetical protein